MRKINKILNTCLFLFIIFSFIQCSIKTSSECKSKKIQLLLEDIFKKEAYYPTYKSLLPVDSSEYFVYLFSPNIKIPNKEFYLHIAKDSQTSFPDSVKLRETNDPFEKVKNSHMLIIEFEEVNQDTTKLKISLGYATPNSTLIDQGTISYSFDEKNCKWSVLDSTISRY